MNLIRSVAVALLTVLVAPEVVGAQHGYSTPDTETFAQEDPGGGSVGSLPLTQIRFASGESIVISGGRVVGMSTVRPPPSTSAAAQQGAPGEPWSPIPWTGGEGSNTVVRWGWWSGGLWWHGEVVRGPSMSDKDWKKFLKDSLASLREELPPDDPQPPPLKG